MHRFGRSFLNPRVLSAGAALACAPIGVAHSHAGRDEEKNILFAVPKKGNVKSSRIFRDVLNLALLGRLHKKIVELLKGASISPDSQQNNSLSHFPVLTIRFIKPQNYIALLGVLLYVSRRSARLVASLHFTS